AAAAVACGLAPVDVAAAALAEPVHQRLLGLGLGDLGEVRVRREAPSGARRLGLANGHAARALPLYGLQALEDRNGLARPHLHDRLLPGAGAPACGCAALGLGLDAQRPYVEHVHVEQLFYRLADLGLVGVGVHPEGVAIGGREHVALLGDHRPDDHVRVLHQAPSSLSPPRAAGAAARSLSAPRAGSERSSEAAPSRSLTPTCSASRTATRARLRKDSAASDSSGASTTSVGRGWPQSS